MHMFKQATQASLLSASPKKIVLSGPSGFLGKHVLDAILDVHCARKLCKLDPGEVILLSSSPGNLMRRLQETYGKEKMRTIRASRVDYFTQHDTDTWIDHLGSLGVGGENSVFVNLAAVAGPKVGVSDAMMDVNYRAPVAAANACVKLGFGHWVQSSTQATNAERAGQVPYSRAKAMTDFALSHLESLSVSIACLGLLYSKRDGLIGQDRSDESGVLNLIDLSLLPLTPIMGDGSAPLQPQEVTDAARRFAYLALTDPFRRPVQHFASMQNDVKSTFPQSSTVRFYDAVGPETITMVDMLKKFAEYQGSTFRPVFVDYRNMERVLNVKSLGNLNRQFVSLLRSEQGAAAPIIGNPFVWESILGEDSKLVTLDDAFCTSSSSSGSSLGKRKFPYMTCLRWVLSNPGVIRPGFLLSAEIIESYFRGRMRTIDPH